MDFHGKNSFKKYSKEQTSIDSDNLRKAEYGVIIPIMFSI